MPENPVDVTIIHIMKELKVEEIKCSIEIEFESFAQAHNSIHQLMSLLPNLFPNGLELPFRRHTSYLVYHWEIFDLAHRSCLDALATYYNAAFILLRSTIELIIRGAFLDCLAHSRFRNKALTMDRSKEGINLKGFLNYLARNHPEIANEMERNSVVILDKTSFLDNTYWPSVHSMLGQLVEWGIMDGIDDPERNIYGTYGRLNAEVHVMPDNTDIGKILVNEGKPFERRKAVLKSLKGYLEVLHMVMDVAMVVSLNITRDNIEEYDSVRDNLRSLISDKQFQALNLTLTRSRIDSIIS